MTMPQSFADIVAAMESPQKFSAVKQRLALKPETIEKGQDSILGESPSPSRQVVHNDWTLISPCKFALKLDKVEEASNQQSRSPGSPGDNDQDVDDEDEEMSSHDLTLEELEKDAKLGVYVETDPKERLDSQRDRHENSPEVKAAITQNLENG